MELHGTCSIKVELISKLFFAHLDHFKFCLPSDRCRKHAVVTRKKKERKQFLYTV